AITPRHAGGSDSVVFFFKQKTAYEIGLGIPAEPLFRSKQELLLLVYELNRSGLLAENEKIRPTLAQLEKLLLCDLSPSTNDSVKIGRASCRERVYIYERVGAGKKKPEDSNEQ